MGKSWGGVPSLYHVPKYTAKEYPQSRFALAGKRPLTKVRVPNLGLFFPRLFFQHLMGGGYFKATVIHHPQKKRNGPIRG